MTPESLWRASDVTWGWPAEALARLVARTETWALAAGAPLPESLGLLGVLHGEVEVVGAHGTTLLHAGSVRTTPASGKAGARGAVLAGVRQVSLQHMPDFALPRPAPLPSATVEPPLNDSRRRAPHGPVDTQQPAPNSPPAPRECPGIVDRELATWGVTRAMRAGADPAGAPVKEGASRGAGGPATLGRSDQGVPGAWFALWRAAGSVWRTRLVAMHHLGADRWGSLAVAVVTLQILSLGLPLFVKFIIDHVLIAQDAPSWPAGLAFVLTAALLTWVLQVATQGVLLDSVAQPCFEPETSAETDLAMARTCAAVVQALSTLAYPVLLMFLAPSAATLLLLGTVAQAGLLYAVAPWQARLALLGRTAMAPAQTHAVLVHADSVLTSGAADTISERLASSPGEDWDHTLEQVHRFDAAEHIMAYVTQALLLGLGSLWVLNHTASPGTYVAALLMGHHLQASWRALHRHAADLPQHLAPPAGTPGPDPGATAWDGALVLDQVQAPNLHGLSLSLPAGSRTAVLGPTGAGKSSLARLCAGLLPCSAGTVSPTGWETHTLYVDPEAAWSAGVLAETLALQKATDRPALLRAVEQACASGCVERLPQHLDTPLTDNDARLCHSERVRLRLAQGLLGAPRLWIIDGALDACPAELADALLTRMTEALPHTTLLLVTRQLVLLQRCPRVLLMRPGQAPMQDSYTALLAQGLVQPWLQHG